MTYAIDISYWVNGSGWSHTETAETGEWKWENYDITPDQKGLIDFITAFAKEWFENGGGAGKGTIKIYADGDDSLFDDPIMTAESEFIEVYYWFEAEYHNQKDCWALHRKNQNDNDEVVLSASYSDYENGIENLDRSSAEYLDTVWRRIDQYIESELGFLPDYSVN